MRLNPKFQNLSQTQVTQQRKPNRFSKEKYFRICNTVQLNSSFQMEQIQLKPIIVINNLNEKMNSFKYLPLDLFEDTTFNKHSNEDIYQIIQNKGPQSAQVLREIENQQNNNNKSYAFWEAEIIDYDFVSEQFKFIINGEQGKCSRIYFLCDFENVVQYTKKLLNAFQQREFVDSMLRYNYYIDNMPTKDVVGISEEQQKRIKKILSSSTKHISFKEVKHQYKRVQNQLQFDRYLEKAQDKIVNLKLLKQNNNFLKQGKLNLNLDVIRTITKHGEEVYLFDFKTIRQQYIDNSIFQMKEVIRAMHQINELNEEILKISFFYTQDQIYEIQQYKLKQETQLHHALSLMKQWTPRIINIIKINCNKVLDKTKLLKLLQVIKMKQQDYLQRLVFANLSFLNQYFISRQINDSIQPIFVIGVNYQSDFKYTYPIKEVETQIFGDIKLLLQELSFLRDPESLYFSNESEMPRTLRCPNAEDENVQKDCQELKKLVNNYITQASNYLRTYDQYKSIFEIELHLIIEQCETEEEFDYLKFRDTILNLQQKQEHVFNQMPETINVSIIHIQNEHLLFQIKTKITQLIDEMLDHFINYSNTQVRQLVGDFESILLQVNRIPNSIQELEKQRTFLLNQLEDILNQQEKRITRINSLYEILDDFNQILPSDHLKTRWNVLSYPFLIKSQKEKQLEFLNHKKRDLQQQFNMELIKFKTYIEQLEKQVNNFALKQNDNYQQLKLESQTLQNQIHDAQEQAKQLNEQEKIFDLPITCFNQLNNILEQFNPLLKLWSIIFYWNQNHLEWFNKPILTINSSEIKEFIDKSVKDLEEVTQYARNKKMYNIVSVGLKALADLNEFQPQLPLLLALTEKGMKKRHWEQLSKEQQIEINVDNKSFKEISQLIKNKDICLRISEQAKQELIVENEMFAIAQRYQTLQLQINVKVEYSTIDNLNDLQAELDDSLSSLNQLLQSPYNTPFKEKLIQFEQIMLQSLEQIEQIKLFQIDFIQLYPLFQEQNLLKQLPMEVNKFKFFEKFWTKLTGQQNIKLNRIKTNNIKEQNSKIQILQKSLVNYLDKKREIFLRFYFLSNLELLQIQYQKKNPNLFIHQLFHFQEVIIKDNSIVTLKIGKTLLSIKPVLIGEKHVEDYLWEVQANMRESLQAYRYNDFINMPPPQIQQIFDEIKFTESMEADFIGTDIPKTYKHQRLFQELKGVDKNSFDWQKHLRYYQENGQIIIRCLNQSFEYDYEFLMNHTDYIHFPQTDRCFVNLIFAISNNFGVLLHGPTGKQETLRYFSQCMGKYYVTMNAYNTNYQLIGQMIKGISGTGAYFTLSNIDQLSPELFSIFMEQLRTIYQSKIQKLDSGELNGQIIKIVPSFSIFLTSKQIVMNNELRSLFRVVYYNQPNANIIIDYLGRELIDKDLLKQFIYLSEINLSIQELRLIINQAKQIGMIQALQYTFNYHKFQNIFRLLKLQTKEQLLNDYIVNNQSIIVVGTCGKSTLIKQIQPNSINIYLGDLDEEYYYGTFEKEGILIKLLDQYHTIIFDGLYQIEQLLNSKILRFPNGRIIELTHKLIYETDTLSHLPIDIVVKVAICYIKTELTIPIKAKPFIPLSDKFKSFITQEHQILQFLKMFNQCKSDQQIINAAQIAFGAHLNFDNKQLLNRYIRETAIMNNYKIDEDQVELQLHDFNINVLYKGPTCSGKSQNLNDPLRMNLSFVPCDLLKYLHQKLIKRRTGIYRIGKIEIDDIHLSENCHELIRSVMDSNGWHQVELQDLELCCSTQQINKINKRLLRHFVVVYLSEMTINSLFNIFINENFEKTKFILDGYQKIKQFFQPTPSKPHFRICINDIFRIFEIDDYKQEFYQYFYMKIDDEQDKEQYRLTFNYEAKCSINLQEVFKRHQLIYYKEAAQVVFHLTQVLPSNIILYGPSGYGKKTLYKIACSILDIEQSLIENPTLEEISVMLSQKKQTTIILTRSLLKEYCKKSSLMNKFHIISLNEWPKEAFQQIEFQYFEQAYTFYQYTLKQSKYLSPIKYINYCKLFDQLHNYKQNLITNQITKLQGGLSLLYSAQSAVNQMNQELTQMRPILEKTILEVNTTVELLQSESQIADEAKKQIESDEAIASEQQKKATQLSDEARQKVEKVNNDLEVTLQEVSKLRKEHLVEIKSLGSPPKAVRIILGGVLILLQIDLKKDEDYLEVAKKFILNDPKELLDMLKHYNRDNIPNTIIIRLEQRILSDPDFTYERAKQCSYAVKFLYSWVKAMYDYNKVFVETQPIRDQLQVSLNDLAQKTQILNQKKAELLEISKKLDNLREILQEKKKQKEQLEVQIEDCQNKIQRSQKLIEGFRDEQKRWGHEIYLLKGQETRNAGDCLIVTSIITFCSALSKSQRKQFYDYSYNYLSEQDIKYTEQCTVTTYLQEKDSFIQENLLIYQYKQQIPIFYDPQHQIQQIFPQFKLLRLDQIKLLIKQIPYFIDITDSIPKYLDNEQTYIITDQQSLNQLNSTILVNTFIINFSISKDLLEDQILKSLIEIENPSLELKKEHNLKLLEKDQETLSKLEEHILSVLSNQTNVEALLMDETLINELSNSKHIYQDTSKRMEITTNLNHEIHVTREQYRLLSEQFAIIYFTIKKFGQINHLYQYSLEWYIKQICQISQSIPKQPQVALNVSALKSKFTQYIISQVGLLFIPQEKLLFCLMLTLEFLLKRHLITKEEINTLISEKQINVTLVNPCGYINDSQWPSIYGRLQSLARLEAFKNILDEVEISPSKFKSLYQQEIIPKEYQNLTPFQTILLINAFRPDTFHKYIINLIEQSISINYYAFNNENIFKYVNSKNPLLILNSQYQYTSRCISLGQGQNQKAEKLILEYAAIGGCVEVSNCQFAELFLKQLDQKLEQMELHQDFKLIMHIQQSQTFPSSLIQKSVKIRHSQPQTIIQQLKEQISQSNQLDHKLFFSLNLFHAITNFRFRNGVNDYNFYGIDLELALKTSLPFLKELIYENQIEKLDNLIYDRTVSSSSSREGFIYIGGELKMIKTSKEGYFKYLDDLGVINDFLACGLNFNHQIIIQTEQNQELIKQYAQVNNHLTSNQYSLEIIIQKIEQFLPLKIRIDFNEDNAEKLDILHWMEVEKLNVLIDIITSTLSDLKSYYHGQCLHFKEIDCLLNNQIPQLWRQYSYDTDKTMLLWLENLFNRVQFFTKWQSLCCYNISYFWMPELLLKIVTGDSNYNNYEYLNKHHIEIQEKPEKGVILYGIKIFGAKYNEMNKKFKITSNFEFFADVPLVHIQQAEFEVYFDKQCPIYKCKKLVGKLFMNSNDQEWNNVKCYL